MQNWILTRVAINMRNRLLALLIVSAVAIALSLPSIFEDHTSTPTLRTGSDAQFLVSSRQAHPNDWNSLTVILSHQCLFGCRAYSVEIHGDGRVIYDGHAFVAVCGKQTSQIPQVKIQELYQAFGNATFFSLDDIYHNPTIPDAPLQTISIAYDGRLKSVSNYGDKPGFLRMLGLTIDQIAGTDKWAGMEGYLQQSPSCIAYYQSKR